MLSGFFSSVGLWRHQKIKPEMLEKTDELLAWLEIEHLAERVIGEMSSGEVRRVMIARALVHEPKALLFDEPSNSLDVSAQIELRRTMSKLAQSGIALLLITHHLPDVVPEIERVIFMRDGRIVGDGSKPELLTAGAWALCSDVRCTSPRKMGTTTWFHDSGAVRLSCPTELLRSGAVARRRHCPGNGDQAVWRSRRNFG